MKKYITIIALILAQFFCVSSKNIHIGMAQDYSNIAEACVFLSPGDSVFVHEGNYDTYQYYNGLKGTSDNWITITKYENENVIINGGWQFTSSEYIRIENLKFQTNTKYNNTLLHFDHAGDCNKLSRHIIVDSCEFYDVQGGNTFKFGGVSDFQISNSKFINNTSNAAGIALNESRNGIINNCYFENIKTKAIQFKLGTTNVLVYANYFKNSGNDDSALKIGESGGKEFYCPDMKDWHAKDIKVYSNIFVGGRTPFSIGLAINSEIINNTIINPNNFVMRILSDEKDYENKNHKIINNIFYLDKSIYFNGSSNAQNIDFGSIVIENNLFYCISKPNWAGPDPYKAEYDAEEIKGVQFINNIIKDPIFKDASNEDFTLSEVSPALKIGNNVLEPVFDFFGKPFKFQRALGAIESDSVFTNISVSSIQLNLQSSELLLGDSINLSVDILPINATNKKINWSSYDNKIASVSDSGLVISHSIGSTYIYAEAQDNGIKDSCLIIVNEVSSINNNENDVLISPNPVKQLLKIKLHSDEIYEIEIFNYFGRKVLTSFNQQEINTSEFAKGIYFLKVKTNRNVYYKKFIKD